MSRDNLVLAVGIEPTLRANLALRGYKSLHASNYITPAYFYLSKSKCNITHNTAQCHAPIQAAIIANIKNIFSPKLVGAVGLEPTTKEL